MFLLGLGRVDYCAMLEQAERNNNTFVSMYNMINKIITRLSTKLLGRFNANLLRYFSLNFNYFTFVK